MGILDATSELYGLYSALKEPYRKAYNDVLLPTFQNWGKGRYDFTQLEGAPENPEEMSGVVENMRGLNDQWAKIDAGAQELAPVAQAQVDTAPILNTLARDAASSEGELAHGASQTNPLFDTSKIDSEISGLTEARGRYEDLIRAPAEVGDAEKIGNLLGVLANFGIGYAVGGGGKMGLGLGLTGAGKTGEAFWQRIDAQKKREDEVSAFKIRETYDTEDRLRQEKFALQKIPLQAQARAEALETAHDYRTEEIDRRFEQQKVIAGIRAGASGGGYSGAAADIISGQISDITGQPLETAQQAVTGERGRNAVQDITQLEDLKHKVRGENRREEREVRELEALNIAGVDYTNLASPKSKATVADMSEAYNYLTTIQKMMRDDIQKYGVNFWGQLAPDRRSEYAKGLDAYRKFAGAGANFTLWEIDMGKKQLPPTETLMQNIEARILGYGDVNSITGFLDRELTRNETVFAQRLRAHNAYKIGYAYDPASGVPLENGRAKATGYVRKWLEEFYPESAEKINAIQAQTTKPQISFEEWKRLKAEGKL